MLHVKLTTDPFDLAAYRGVTATGGVTLLDLLQDEFPVWPETARLYRGTVAVENDVTPTTEAEVAALDGTTEGDYWVVVYPGDPVTALVTIVATLAIMVAVLLLMPAIPVPAGATAGSSNNSLSDRVNKPRLNGRVADIFGKVRSIPDLLAVPYKTFKDHREVEVAYLCVGRGAYVIADICDDNTPVSEIEGMQVEVYGPSTSPLSGAPPQLSIGAPITEELLDVRRSTAVNGQTLYPQNYKRLVATDNVRAENSTQFKIRDTAVFVWPQFFEVGDIVIVTNGTVDGKALSGSFTVAAVSNDFLTLDNPGAISPAWNTVATPTSWYGPTIQSDAVTEVGPFYADIAEGGKLICNVIAPAGLYLQNNERQLATDVGVEFTLTPVDGAGSPIGAPQVFTDTVRGSATTRSLRAKTIICDPTGAGRFEVTVKRLTDTDYAFDGTVVDEIKWRDMYVANAINVLHFGDVTTILAVTYNTDGATAIKERRLNMDATRKVLARNLDNTFGPALVASQNAADIICHMALDPFIGSRTLGELDVPQIYDTMTEVVAYFGITASGQFGYTFDQENVSFEEMVQSVAQAVFCTAYRQGSRLRLFFERATEDSTLLFNHRNKVPGSERRTVRFGYLNDHDGIELDYTSATDGAKLTVYMPADQSAVKPKKVEMIGVQNEQHALIHAYRLWNKIRYQHTVTEFTGLSEASQLVLNERIEITDNTRPDVFDGHVIDQDGLVLTLSQPFTPAVGVAYVIHLQNPEGGLEVIDVEAGASAFTVVLQGVPTFSLARDSERAADIVYQIVGDDTTRASAFLLTEKGAYDKKTIGIQAINYDPRYYQADETFKL